MTTPYESAGMAMGSQPAAQTHSTGFFNPGKKKNWKKNPGLRPVAGHSQSTGSLLEMSQQSWTSASQLGRSSSTSQMKSTQVKLPPLPKQPLNFDNLYSIAKKRAQDRKNECRSKSPPSSPLKKTLSRGFPAMLLDTQPESPEEAAWAADVVATVVKAEEDEPKEAGVASRAPTKGSEQERRKSVDGGSRKSSKSRSSSKAIAQFDSVASLAEDADAQILSPLSQGSQPGSIVKRPTRELAAEASSAYVQALRQMMESDDSNSMQHLDTFTVASACLSGATNQRLHLSANGFTEDEMKRMKSSFYRFKQSEGMEIHKDDLPQVLSALGYMKVSAKNSQTLADEITTYSMLDWEEFCDFVEKFAHYEKSEFRREFDQMDEDGSGQLNIVELRTLISSLGVTPFRDTLAEAMQVVDFDGSGQLDFDEFVHLMAVYRVAEGFTRADVRLLKELFERVAVPVPGGPKEVKPGRLVDVLVRLFGPQSHGLAKKMARRFENGDFSDPTVKEEKSDRDVVPEPSSPTMPSTPGWGETPDWSLQPGLPFPEFLLFARRLREAEIEHFRKQFQIADIDNSGFIQADEIRQVITSVGYMPLKTIVAEVLSKVDVDGDASLDFDEFCNLMQVFRKTDGFTEAEIAELTQVFGHYKTDSDEVDCLELMEILRSMGYVTHLDVVRRFVQQVDFDNSNTLDLAEFIRLMRMHRENELNQALEVFNSKTIIPDGEEMRSKDAASALRKIGYLPTDEQVDEFLMQLTDAEAGETKPPEDLDFNDFAVICDNCRKSTVALRRTHAGYSEKEVEDYRKAFVVYDEDGSGDVEKEELTKLLSDLNIPLRSRAEQKAMLDKLDIARQRAKEHGVEEEDIGEWGVAAVTFHVLLFLVRMLQTAADHAEVDRDKMIMEKTHFTPKEAEEFREIFTFWSVKAAALDEGGEAPDQIDSQATGVSGGGGNELATQARNQHLTPSGMSRVVRSLGLHMNQQEKREMEDRIEAGPTCQENPGKYGFFEFLLFMRWMMDTNFAHINEMTAPPEPE
jgi:Ca2+-binding EF-hand superfamily protein